MLDKLTLENLDRRKLEIQGRIRNLEERIQRKYPYLKPQGKSKNLSISTEILSLTLGSPRHQTLQCQAEEDNTKQNAPNLHEMLKKALERQAHVEQELRGIRSRMPSKDARQEATPTPIDSAPQRYFGAAYDLNSADNGCSPRLYSYRQERSPINNAIFSADQEQPPEQEEESLELDQELSITEEEANTDEKILALRECLTLPRNNLFESEQRLSQCPQTDGKISHFKVMTSCRKLTHRDRDNSISNKNTERHNSGSKFDRFEPDMSSPSNYMEKYIKAIKGRQRIRAIPKFDSIEIADDTRNKVVERIEARIIGSMSQQKENTKSGKHEKDSLLSSFDLQYKLRDGLLKKVFEMQDVKKYK